MPNQPEVTDSNVSWLKPNQVESMRDAAYDGRHGQRDEAIVTVLYDTGLRRGELSQVNQDMLDLRDSVLRIPAEIQKDYPNDNSPNPATFELDPEGDLSTVRTLRSYLDTRDDNSNALFPSQKSDRLTPKAINEVVKKAVKRASVRPHTYAGRGTPDDVSAHTLRHSVAYRLLHDYDDYTLYDVRNRLRHATILTTERKYDHFETI
ncbi:tyrosine-type recombinase/integrase [Halorhabdus amylolytica]|uniref:tyrosine-type recombinase/integrase n=1 Tax=Halorhabdus amylolytica TaxID=2559573 RepID=UPI0010AA724C|nr:site-specific integrase [Halorhabdus amylolytica]